MPGQGCGSGAAPPLPALEAGRKEQRRECGRTYPQVEGGCLDWKRKKDFQWTLHITREALTAQGSPHQAGSKGTHKTSASSWEQLWIQLGDFSKVPEI